MTKTAALNVKALKAVNLFAPREATRYYLNGVLITVNARNVFYVATDGHRMLVHREDLAEGAEDNTLTGSWIVPSSAIDAIKGGTGRFAETPATLAEVGNGEYRLDAPKGSTIFKPIDGSFPDWHRVIPRGLSKGEVAVPHQFNLHYGASFAKAAELLGYNTLAPHFHHAAAGNPLAVTFGEGRQTFGVLMPVRADANEWTGLPVWAGGEAPKVETTQQEAA
jgi:hypothetical protein